MTAPTNRIRAGEAATFKEAKAIYEKKVGKK